MKHSGVVTPNPNLRTERLTLNVRLSGLKATRCNGRICSAVEFDERKKRYGIYLHGEKVTKASKEINLTRHSPLDPDVCPKCSEQVSIFAFQPCERGLLDEAANNANEGLTNNAGSKSCRTISVFDAPGPW